MVEKIIVEAVAVASNAGGLGPRKSELARAIETAMAEAIQQCLVEGISDPDLMRERMQEARIKAKNDFYRE